MVPAPWQAWTADKTFERGRGLRKSIRGPKARILFWIRREILRLAPLGLYAWEFEKGSRELRVRVEGRLAFNTATLAVNAALAGDGLAFVPQERVQEHIRAGRLVRALADWRRPFPGFHLYCPSRRQPTPAFAVLVGALRYRDGHSRQADEITLSKQ